MLRKKNDGESEKEMMYCIQSKSYMLLQMILSELCASLRNGESNKPAG